MSEFLAYRLPNQSIEAWSGSWEPTTLEEIDLKKDTFVLSDFDQSNIAYFKATKKQTTIHTKNLGESTNLSIEKKQYLDDLSAVKQKMQINGIEKIVFSRIKSHRINSTKLFSIFEKLTNEYPEAFVYFLFSKTWGCWMGATPELLIENQEEKIFKTLALAGTLPKNSSNWTSKEKVEQQYVSDFIEESICSHGKLISKSETSEKIAGPIKHLATYFKFELQNENLKNLIPHLHPTPAVCGVPLEDAKTLIFDSEQHNRTLYTGFLGRIGKNTQLYVNLRCMQCFDNSADIYVGGGITKDSDVNNEWEETERKAATIIDVIEKI